MFFDIPVGLQKPAVAPTLRVKWSGEKRGLPEQGSPLFYYCAKVGGAA